MKPEPDYFEIHYPRVLNMIELECPDKASDYYFKGKLNGEEFCHYAGINDRVLHLSKRVSFTTPGPSFNTNDSLSDVKTTIWFGVLMYDIFEPFNHFVFKLPFEYDLERTGINYLDSFFRIETHKVQSDLMEDDAVRFEFLQTDMVNDTVNTGYIIPSWTGSQDESYIKIRKAERSEEFGKVYYDVEIEIECNLYHWPNYRMSGLWGRLEEGLLVAKFEMPDN